MGTFRYEAVALEGVPARGVIEADDRKSALQKLAERGLYPSQLEPCDAAGAEEVALVGRADGGLWARLGPRRVRRQDRVGCRGLRPGTLPHHRTCGFPHPAVERSGASTWSPQGLMA